MNGLPGIVGLVLVAMFAFVLAAPPASRRLHRHLTRAAGGPSARPAIPAAGRAAVPRRAVQPSSSPTGPFAYDNGLVIEEDP